MNAISSLTIETPRAFLPLLGEHRFKGAKGGRGSGKSHFVAEMLIEECVMGHQRIACLRETQTSLEDSVKRLLSDKIKALGVESLFVEKEFEIIGPNDSLFIFKGLQRHTAGALKSLEGFTRGWVEEAQYISQRSLDVLTPTFRKSSQMIFTWNPYQPTDPVEQLFAVAGTDPDFALIDVTFRDNPWFPDELRRDMLRDQSRDPEKYAHVWLGSYIRNSEARVFKNWRVEEFETPAKAEFWHGADWGFSVDPTVLIRCRIDGRKLYVDQEVYKVGCEIDDTPALFDKVDGARGWTIRADAARPETISYMKRNGYPKIVAARKGPGSVEEGVTFLQSFDIVVHPRCRHTIDELTHYAYKVDAKTGDVLPVLEDRKNHVIDALRYAVEGLRRAPAQIHLGAY